MSRTEISIKQIITFLGIAALLSNIALGWFPVGGQITAVALGIAAIAVTAVDFGKHPENRMTHLSGFVLGSIAILYAAVSFFSRALPVMIRAGWI